MTFRLDYLRREFSASGDHGFTVWAYGTTDRPAQVLAPGYFATAKSTFQPGDLLYLGTTAPPDGIAYDDPRREHRRALLMVVTIAGPGGVTTRLVQDFGCPEAEPADHAPPPTAAAPVVAVRQPRSAGRRTTAAR